MARRVARRSACALFLWSWATLVACGDGVSDDATDAQEQLARVKTTLYIHGRIDHAPTGWEYWGRPGSGPNAVPVNWDGRDCLERQNPVIVGALDRHCRMGSCYVVCHSAGCAQIEYALDVHGAIDGRNRWDILFVVAAGSAEGGSEIADVGSALAGDCLADDLQTIVIRPKYDHNNTRGVPIFMHAGAGGGTASLLLPGEDDGTVAYHSAGGARRAGPFGNPGGAFPALPSTALFNNRVLEFLDTRAEVFHSITSSNRGIVGIGEQHFSMMAR